MQTLDFTSAERDFNAIIQRVEKSSPTASRLPAVHTVDVTFRQMTLDEDLFQSIRNFCQLVGDALCDGSEWRIVLDRLQATFRVTALLKTPQGVAQNSAEGTDPYGAALRSIAGLLER